MFPARILTNIDTSAHHSLARSSALIQLIARGYAGVEQLVLREQVKTGVGVPWPSPAQADISQSSAWCALGARCVLSK